MEFGVVGLGKMGGNLALQAAEKNIKVVGKARSPKPELERRRGIRISYDFEDFVSALKHPRIIYLSLPAGPTIDDVLSELSPLLQKGDVVVDGGNSYYRDSIRREKESSKKGIYYLDCGTSGGIEGARHGACFMVGGRKEGVKLAEPILRALSVKGGYIHAGGPGSGHFVKLVHNGIEFGMLQAIGEGVALLRNSGFDLNLAAIFRNWSHGSVIRSWLIELMEKGLRENKDLDKIPNFVEDTGEVNWLVHEAIEREIPIPVITQSVIELFKSRDKKDDPARSVALMRHGFGGHPFGKDKKIARERRTSRIYRI